MKREKTAAPASVGWRRAELHTGVALLAGVMMTTAMPPFPYTGALAVPALALLFVLVSGDERPGRRAWFFGLAHQTTLLYWLFFLDPAKSIPTRLLVPVQAVAAILYVSAFYALFGWAMGRLRRLMAPGGDSAAGSGSLAVAPVLWVGMEMLRGWGELGFPWCLTGAAWIMSPVRPLAAASGEIGLSAATALLGAAVGWLFLRGKPSLARRGGARPAAGRDGPARALPYLAAAAWAALALGTWLGGVSRPPGDDLADSGVAQGSASSLRGPDEGPAPDRPRTAPFTVAAVQADVSLRDKWDPARIDSTRLPYAALTAEAAGAGATLVVWAETAIPAYLRYSADLLDWARRQARDNDVWLYTGFPDAERDPLTGETLRFNSSGLLAPDGTLVDRYAKHHLLPIGERMPFSDVLPIVGRIDVGQAEWRPGARPQPLTFVTMEGRFSFAGLICFEGIFGDLARQAVRRGAQALVNITNDGWFGNSSGPLQHAELARLRAVECGVPLIRAANNGISYVCDPRGRYLGYLGLGERGYVAAVIQPVRGDTPFLHLGSWPMTGALALWLTVALLWWRRAGRGGAGR
ncbi:MAG: apolipoprotein N-acyltransferase [Candidatus Krumholzibacteriia bacterium]